MKNVSLPHLTSIFLRDLTSIADAQVTDANADANKDVKAEEMGEPVCFGSSLNFDFFFVSNTLFCRAQLRRQARVSKKNLIKMLSPSGHTWNRSP
jgi:hypothetical protein